MNQYTEEAVLAHHGIAAENGLDHVRCDALVVSLCLGCASIMIAPDLASRNFYAANIDWDEVDCCPNAKRVVY